MPTLQQEPNYGGNRTFAPLVKAGTLDTMTIHFPTFSVAGSTADHVNYAILVWPGGAAANLGTALSALNGLSAGTTPYRSNNAFAPGSTGPTTVSSPANGQPSINSAQSKNSETPAQQRCIVLTGDTTRCLQ